MRSILPVPLASRVFVGAAALSNGAVAPVRSTPVWLMAAGSAGLGFTAAPSTSQLNPASDKDFLAARICAAHLPRSMPVSGSRYPSGIFPFCAIAAFWRT